MCITLISSQVFATSQYGDILIDGKDTVEIYSNPLEVYLENKKSRTINGYDLKMTSTACYRGYLATWELKNDSLFLIEIRNGCSSLDNMEPEYFNLKDEFGSDIVFANWVTQVLYIPCGDLLKYIHAGYSSIFEKEKYIYLIDGKLDSVRYQNNILYEKGKIKPTSRYLSDTLTQIIIDYMDTSYFSRFEDKEMCALSIKFDSEGKVDKISNEFTNDGISYFEQIVYEAAVRALSDFPLLMKVIHEDYKYTFISLSFHSHCFKNPDDYEYGCRK